MDWDSLVETRPKDSPHYGAPPHTSFFRSCLDYLTRPGLLSERISSLTGEADQKTVGTLIVDHIFLDILDGSGDGYPLDVGLPPQLLHHHHLLLDVGHVDAHAT